GRERRLVAESFDLRWVDVEQACDVGHAEQVSVVWMTRTSTTLQGALGKCLVAVQLATSEPQTDRPLHSQPSPDRPSPRQRASPLGQRSRVVPCGEAVVLPRGDAVALKPVKRKTQRFQRILPRTSMAHAETASLGKTLERGVRLAGGSLPGKCP